MTNGAMHHGRGGDKKKSTAKKDKQKDPKSTIKRKKMVPGSLNNDEKNR